MIGKTILVIFLIILGIAGGYYLGANYKLIVQPQGSAASATIPPQISAPVQVSVTIVPTVDESADIVSAVKTGLIAEHGPDASTMTVSVSTVSGNFAKGMANATGGGGLWFAAKTGTDWKLVWDGNGIISCVSIASYNFPATMIPSCFDEATQKTVTR